jgi:ribosome-associated protein
MSSDGPSPQPGTREELAPGVWVARSDLQFVFVRASGPGGQAVNKLSTQAQLRVPMSAIAGLGARATGRLRRLAGQRLTKTDELLFQAQTHRSQLDNRRACLQRLRELVIAALKEPRPRKKTRPTRAMIEKRLAAKRKQAEKKRDRRANRPPRGDLD